MDTNKERKVKNGGSIRDMEEGEEDSGSEENKQQRQNPTTLSNTVAAKKLTLIPLIFLIYFEVAGGPFGEEPAVAAAGPLCAILGFIIFPFIWSVPEALITAELATTFPGDGGFVIWAHEAFGPFWGSAMGFTKFLSGVINCASFPVLFVDYLKKLFPIISSGYPRNLAILIFTISMSFLNYTGLSIVGFTSVFLGLISLSPFMVMCLMSIPKIEPHRWLDWGKKNKDWNLFFNTLFWNLNFWDNVSTVAGEVERPQKIFPMALLSSVVFTCLAYLIPLLAIIGSMSVHQDQWMQGFYADAAEMVSGKWLQIWIEIGATLSAVGLYEAQLSSCAYGLLGMADLGFLPLFFANRCRRFGTPWVGILLSAAITLAVSYMNFTDIISSANFLYSLGMLLEFASFVWLRIESPGINRPYRVPMKIPGLVVMCLIPSTFLIYIMVIATKTVFLASGLMIAAVIVMYFLVKLCKSKKLLRFDNGGNDF